MPHKNRCHLQTHPQLLVRVGWLCGPYVFCMPLLLRLFGACAHLHPAGSLPENSPVQAEMVLPGSFILGNVGSVVAGKCQPSLGNTSSGCVSPCVQTCWRLLVFHQASEWRIRPICIYICMYVCVRFLLQVTGEWRVWVLICVCVGSSADAVCQLESQHRALRHQPRLPFCLLSHLEGGKM